MLECVCCIISTPRLILIKLPSNNVFHYFVDPITEFEKISLIPKKMQSLCLGYSKHMVLTCQYILFKTSKSGVF